MSPGESIPFFGIKTSIPLGEHKVMEISKNFAGGSLGVNSEWCHFYFHPLIPGSVNPDCGGNISCIEY